MSNHQMDAINDSNMHLCYNDKRIPNVLIQRYENSMRWRILLSILKNGGHTGYWWSFQHHLKHAFSNFLFSNAVFFVLFFEIFILTPLNLIIHKKYAISDFHPLIFFRDINKALKIRWQKTLTPKINLSTKYILLNAM